MTAYNRFVSLDLVEEVETQFSECRLDRRAYKIVADALREDTGADAGHLSSTEFIPSHPPTISSRRRAVRVVERVDSVEEGKQ